MAITLRTAARITSALAAEHEVTLVLRFAGLPSDPVVRWEHSREFFYQGFMYDVDMVSDSSGVRIITAHRDVRETEVVDAAKQCADTEENNPTARVPDFNKLLLFSSPITKSLALSITAETTPIPTGSQRWNDVTVPVEVPPPKTHAA